MFCSSHKIQVLFYSGAEWGEFYCFSINGNLKNCRKFVIFIYGQKRKRASIEIIVDLRNIIKFTQRGRKKSIVTVLLVSPISTSENIRDISSKVPRVTTVHQRLIFETWTSCIKAIIMEYVNNFLLVLKSIENGDKQFLSATLFCLLVNFFQAVFIYDRDGC